MKLTNHAGLPPSLVHAVAFSERNREGCDYTITELLLPPRILALKRKHEAELEEDASERIWALMGSAGHEVLRRSAKAQGIGIAEERAVIELDGKKIGGQLDYALSEDKCLRDFKFTSVWAVKEGVKPEWEQQLNAYRYLAHHYGVEFERLEIVALLRDWSKPEAARSRDYPQVGVAVLPVEVWTLEHAEAWLIARIRLHEVAKNALPECSSLDMWERPERWAVKKKGNVRATRVLDTEREAVDWSVLNGKPGQFEIERRPGERVRCQSYCVCAPFCEQFQAWRQANQDETNP